MATNSTSRYATVADLAALAHAELESRGLNSPGLNVLIELFRIMYAASMATEESQAITFELTWIDPGNPDPDPPEQINADRWTAVSFASRIPLSTRSLVKAAKATDPRTSSFAVFATEEGSLFIWGLVDQGNRPYEFMRYESDSGQDRPGVFQASAIGIGHISAYIEYEPIAELRIDRLYGGGFNLFRSGPIFDAIGPGRREYVDDVKAAVLPEVYEDRDHWELSLSSQWTETLVRVLLRIRGMGHGGAVLITADGSEAGLDVKYSLDYARLPEALHRWGVATIAGTHAGDLIWVSIDTDQASVSVEDYLEEQVANHEKEAAESEIDGAVWFIACLSRVDGLVLMREDLSVMGFGTVITVEDAPNNIRAAQDDVGDPASLSELSYDAFGTRHRSMMRYCNAYPDSVGFVVSQDGDVRAIRKVNDYLVVWDGVRLQRVIPATSSGRSVTAEYQSHVDGDQPDV
jgi:hypothetical protein